MEEEEEKKRRRTAERLSAGQGNASCARTVEIVPCEKRRKTSRS